MFTLNSFGGNNDTIAFDAGNGQSDGRSRFRPDTLTLTDGNGSMSMSISGGSLTDHDGTVSGALDLTLLNAQVGVTYDLGTGTGYPSSRRWVGSITSRCVTSKP